MLSYCNTNLYAEKINILNNMLNLENVQFQKYVSFSCNKTWHLLTFLFKPYKFC